VTIPNQQFLALALMAFVAFAALYAAWRYGGDDE
jgi:hypothetical protein